ncbi:sulfoquinovosidase-like [Mya arenaria]|uniref:sulfoquinovosidase-like n=1 Tax=Mya arenaria TaxID=6604 RepID=UPI0022E20139|nr:sulfoquinovosidase-like [Mya arenaria]
MRFGLTLLLVFLSIICEASCQKNYTPQWLENNSLNIKIGNDVMIISHNVSKPFIYLCSGQVNFTEFRGNFFVNNYEAARVPLGSFRKTGNTNTSDTFEFSFGSLALNVTFETTTTYPLVVSFSSLPTGYTGLWVRIAATPGERVYGLGEQYSYLNLRGRMYPIWTREQGVGRNKSDIVTFFADNFGGGAGGDYHTTYFPQSTFLSNRKYLCHYGGYNYAEVNLQQPDFHEIFVSGPPDKFYFDTRGSIKELTQTIAKNLGLQPELPDWVYTGAILGVQGGTELMLDRYQKAVDNDVAVSGLWIQDWAGVLVTSFGKRLFWDWHWNATYYPNLNSTIDVLREKGVRVLAYINPNLNTAGSLYQEAAAGKHLVMNTSGQPYLMDFGEFLCGIVDLTSLEARTWYKEKIQLNMIDLGLGGWMADFGEYVAADGAVFQSGETGRQVHNKWPLLWAEVNRQAIEERNKTGEVVFWMRAGTAGVGKYTTLMWAGDQNVDFSYADGLASTIPAALNMGMSGIGITHYDIGGYTTAAQFQAFGQALIRSQELLLRSAEAAVFTPLFRSHEGNQPAANVQFYTNQYIEQCFGRLSRMFVHISNYTRSVAQDNSLFGTPAQRPLFMEFPDDSDAWDVTYQYMYGSRLLVAPVISSNVSKMNVYLPKGWEWKFIWDGKNYPGGNFTQVDSLIGFPPAFYKVDPSDHRFDDMIEQIRSKFPAIPPLLTTPTTPKPIAAGMKLSVQSFCVLTAVVVALMI